MMDVLKVLKLARSQLSQATKQLLYVAFENDFDFLIDLLANVAQDYFTSDDHIRQEYALTLKNNGNFLTLSDKQYPKLLKQVDTAPIILSIKGNNDILCKRSVAVVGSRTISIEDINFIKPAVKSLNTANFVVISGLAYGTDAVAHLNSLRTGTIAVLPCGLGNCYPQEHLFLADKIIEHGGAIISEFSFNEPPKQYHFTHRNRIIVAISNAVLCCRARDLKSGTMSSANYAIKYNKSIYTHIFNGKSEGNKWLLNNGAIDVDDFDTLTYNIIADIAKNELSSYENSKQILNNKYNINNTLFSRQNKMQNAKNIPIQSLKNEIDSLIQSSNLAKTEKNLRQILTLCSKQLQIQHKDILKILIPAIFEKQ